jgi:hypothetical protein
MDERKSGGSKERLGSHIRCNICASCQGTLQKRQSFIAMTAYHPEALQGRTQAQGHFSPLAF